MAEETSTVSASELLGMGRRHLAVKDYLSATEVLAKACEALAAEHGDSADECAEAYLWYGKSLLGLSLEKSGVLGDGVTGSGNYEEEEEDDDEAENGDEAENEKTDKAKTNGETEKVEAQSTKDEVPVGSTANGKEAAEPGPSNGGGDADESAVEETEDEVENLQLAWEMLDLSRSILERRGAAGRALLADVHLTLGKVALERQGQTYDKAIIDMQSCLELQKQLNKSDDRHITETHCQIGLANSLASNFEDANTHFKNAANILTLILENRIKILENPSAAKEDATVKKYSTTEPQYSIEAEIKELKELLPEIKGKIQDMMDYKAETIKRVRETLCSSNSDGPSSSSSMISSSNGAGSNSSSAPKPAASYISHLIKRIRQFSESGEAEGSAPKKAA